MTTLRFRSCFLRALHKIILVVITGFCLHSQAGAVDARLPESNPMFSSMGNLADRASELVFQAMSMIGIRYKYGGNTPESGMDCSGLVRYVFKESWGANLPRTAEEISRVGQAIDPNDLQSGDLVFYNTLKRTFSHVGIYLGDNKFIHASSEGGQVRIENMDLTYWKNRFNGARRMKSTE